MIIKRPQKKEKISILFLGAGKRVSLLKCFRKTAKKLNIKFKAFSYEKDICQPISKEAKIIVGKSWNDIDIDKHILKTIEKHKIDIVIANTDPSTVCLSRLNKLHKSCSISSDISSVQICFSKLKFQKFCEENNLPIIPREEKNFPILAKPDFGSASKGIKILNNSFERKNFFDNENKDYLLQRYIDGVEYTIDIYISKNKEICCISPRIRLSVVGGESDITRTVNDNKIRDICKRVVEKFDFIGPITVQLIQDKNSLEIFLMEINPRLGGAVTASIKAGYDIPKMIFFDFLNLKNNILDSGNEIIMKRYFEDTFYEVNN